MQFAHEAYHQKWGGEFVIAGGPGIRLTGGSGPELALRIGDG